MSTDDDEQRDLFGIHEQTRSRTTDPWTSKAAARRIMRVLSDKHRQVKEIHRQHPKGLTDWELEELCRDHGATYRTRRQELSNPEWFNPPYIVNSSRTKCNRESDHPETERIVWVWWEYLDPTLAQPLPESASMLRSTNAHFDGGRLIHETCAVCGKAGAPFGVGVSLKAGHLGMWYCAEHKPNQ